MAKSKRFKNLCKKHELDYKEIPEVMSFEHACELLGIEAKVPSFRGYPRKHVGALRAHYQLIIVAEALNEGWEPDWSDSNQYKFCFWPEVAASKDQPAGFGFSYAGTYCDFTYSTVGSRLCFRTRSLAKYAGIQFQELYKQYFLFGQ